MRVTLQYYRELARDEPCSSAAQDYMWIARRCNDLIEKNKRLSYLYSQIDELPPTECADNLIAVKELPDAWCGNHPPQIEHIRRVALRARNPRANWVLMQAAEDVMRLMARNRALRDALDRYEWANKERTQWLDWVLAYQREVEQQAECYCVLIDDLPSICRPCRPYCGGSPTSLRDVE